MRALLIDDAATYCGPLEQALLGSVTSVSAVARASASEGIARLMALATDDVCFINIDAHGLSIIRRARTQGANASVIALARGESVGARLDALGAGADDLLCDADLTARVLDRALHHASAISASRHVERIAKRRLAIVEEAAQIGTWEWDLESNTFSWSPREYMLFGLDPARAGPVAYSTWREHIHPADRTRVEARLSKAVLEKSPFELTFRIMRPDVYDPTDERTVRWLSARGEVQCDARGVAVRVVGINLDVSEQHNGLDDLRLQHWSAIFRTYFDSAADSLFHVGPTIDGQLVYESINPAGLAHMGLTLDAVRGKTPEEVLGPVVGGAIMSGLRTVYETGVPYIFQPTFDVGGRQVTYDAVYLPLRDESGAVIGILGSARDITEQRRLERTLQDAQKMEALGQLSSGIAHDFNNVLNGLLMCIELLGMLIKTEPKKKLVSDCRAAIHRGSALTSRLLAFSKQEPVETEPVDVNASLEAMSDMLGRTLGSEVTIETRLAAGLRPAKVDRHLLELATINLAVNARDAMPTGGALTIETRRERIRAQTRGAPSPGEYVAVVVTDTGVGMPPDVLANAKTPFFTTKPPGKGTGLGLSMVCGFVREVGGNCEIASEVGKGTCVTLYLPCERESETDNDIPPDSGL